MVRISGVLSEKEKAELPELNFKQIKRMVSYLKPFITPVVFMLLIQAVSSSITLVPQILSKRIVDDALLGKNMSLLMLLLGASLGFAMLSFFINNFSDFIRNRVSWKMKINMKTQLFEKLVHMDYDFFKNEKEADIKARLSDDVSEVTDTIFRILPQAVDAVSVFITAFAAMGTVDWRLIVTGLAVFPLKVLPNRLRRTTSHKRRVQRRELNIEEDNFVDKTLCVNGSLLMKLFANEKNLCNHYSNLYQKKYLLSKKEQKEGLFFSFIMVVLSKINSVLVYFVAGILMIWQKNDAITVGSVTMTMSLCTRLVFPVDFLMSFKTELQSGLASFYRILEYLDRKNKINNPQNGIKKKVCDGDIEFRNVNFAYSDDIPLLKDVSFTLPAGKTFALVGPSGAGKSSVINLIPRLYDVVSGKITVGGADVKDIDLEYLRSNIGVVTQDTYLFDGTILDNLLYAKENASQQEIEDACSNANIHEFIMSLPDGYETLVGNRGLKLSGGERQRLAIARVLLKNPKILILDEATSALDSISENAVQQALERLLVGRTSIIIAHRLSTVLNADRIMVLKDGRIVEQGSHRELVALNGAYKELFDTQFKKVLDFEKVA
ncbi:MAG: ABC transporter ATP-binding protein [Treponema sp.]|nr:ABC transporter ATP-binding protein [Treponema sp.]